MVNALIIKLVMSAQLDITKMQIKNVFYVQVCLLTVLNVMISNAFNVKIIIFILANQVNVNHAIQLIIIVLYVEVILIVFHVNQIYTFQMEYANNVIFLVKDV